MLSPLKMALRHHYLIDDLRLTKTMTAASPPVNPEILMQVPGELNQRNTVRCSGSREACTETLVQPLGELNWLLMAILETIAFQSLPIKLFRKLFRSNSGLAGLARGFILA
jgi:regulator-associated protein of mTOR